jgi:hypothetical protein
MIPLFDKTTILQTFHNWFSNTFEKKMITEMLMSPIVSENIYRSFTPLLETLFNFTMARSSLSDVLSLLY